jgi:CDP-paratose 2-epimerase
MSVEIPQTPTGGTLNLLEAMRRSCPESPFLFINKVYGDAPELPPASG